VAIPIGQLFESHALRPKQSINSRTEFDTKMPSAPNANALIKSTGVRSPPVIIKLISDLPARSKCYRARADAGIIGTEILSLKISVAAPAPSRTMKATATSKMWAVQSATQHRLCSTAYDLRYFLIKAAITWRPRPSFDTGQNTPAFVEFHWPALVPILRGISKSFNRV
jgi:hypothetical protein